MEIIMLAGMGYGYDHDALVNKHDVTMLLSSRTGTKNKSIPFLCVRTIIDSVCNNRSSNPTDLQT